MDPVTSAIIAALAAGGTSKTGETGVADAYDTFKAVLKQKFGLDSDLIEAINLLEKKPDSAGRKEMLKEEVATVKADQDPEILAATRTLLDKISQVNGTGRVTRGVVRPAPATYIPLQRPGRPDHFTGREAELSQLLSSLRPGQIVTLCGPGGIGKSALAAEAVWTLAPRTVPPDRFPDGVIYHNFYNRPQATLALEQIARAFGEELWPTPHDAAQRALAGRQVLLVLDGAEQADDLPQVLAVGNRCGVLITSRRCEETDGERQDIPPLSLDEATSLLQTWDGARGIDEVTAQRVCELIGGIPLAIRLAGHYLAMQQETVTDYLDWLQETPLAALDHNQGYEASVHLLLERSLAQMSEATQQVLAVVSLLSLAPFWQEVIAEGLAVGVQGGLLATVQKIFKQKPEQSRPEVSLALDELVNYGLLRWVGRRYEVSHAMIHTYARQHLTSPAQALGRLVTYYTTLAGEQILLGLDGYATLDAERPHLMGVLAACVEQEDWEAAYSLAAAIEDYLDLRGYRTERLIANQTGLLATRKLGRRHNEGAWLGNLGLAYSDIGQVEQAIKYYKEALTVAREIGDRRGEGNSLGKLGLAYRDLEQVHQARQYLERSLAIFEEINSPSADMVRDWLAEFEEAQP